MHTTTIILGAGLSGLQLATLLAHHDTPYIVLEARERIGGRAHTISLPSRPETYFDMGPAWVWTHQPRALSLARTLGLELFEQHSAGNLVFQNAHGLVDRSHELAMMQGSLRIHGGIGALAHGLASALDPDTLHLGAVVRRLDATQKDRVTVNLEDGRTFEGSRVVLTAPPRLTAETLEFSPALSEDLQTRMKRTPTWMAGHAKALAIYETPFWRENGLSGDGISHRGPLGELHDASPLGEDVGALFGFFATPPAWRRAHADTLREIVLDQLAAMFGEEARDPIELFIVDWADDRFLATSADEEALRAHPKYSKLTANSEPWTGRVLFSGTEATPNEGGYIEGALNSAHEAFEVLRGQ